MEKTFESIIETESKPYILTFINLKFILIFVFFLPFSVVNSNNLSTKTLKNKEIAKFVEKMHLDHQISKSWLNSRIKNYVKQKKAIRLISPDNKKRKKIKKNWYAYRKNFITSKNINSGRKFLIENQSSLEKASKTFGVPVYIIAGIIGVETRFGKIKGSFPVFDTLASLSFDQNHRKDFFKKELKEFLILAKENQIDISQAYGSFAGAMGIPQFMPSSWRSYAIDFNNDGRIDLINSSYDAIGSIANFLSNHGWKKNELTHALAKINKKTNPNNFLAHSLKTRHNVELLSKAGFYDTSGLLPPKQAASLIDLPIGKKNKIFWIATENFFSITMYNRSYMYAAAVLDLADALKPNIK